MRPLQLVDQFGSPVRSARADSSNPWSFYQSGGFPLHAENPWRYYDAAYDTDELLPYADWKQLLSSARFLFANVPIVRGCLLEQMLYSFPLEARYTGPDKEWGELAENAIYEWRQNPTLRGWPYDGHLISRARLLGYKVDGDIFTILTTDADGNPKIQIERAHRIGTRLRDLDKEGRIPKGPYRGKRICNGAIIDDFGSVVAYQILGKTADQDQFVPSSGMFPTVRPDYYDEYRGISHLVASIRSFSDHKRLREYELRAMAMQSAYVLNNKTETGLPNMVNLAVDSGNYPTASVGSGASPSLETIEGGILNYVKAGTGSGLEFLRPDRPGENWQSFESRITSAALRGAEWEPGFSIDMAQLGGANSRIILQKINRCILMNAGVEARTQRREDWYKLETDIANGLLRPPSDRNTRAFTYHLALPQLTADTGNEESAKREAYKLGLSTLLSLTTEKGQDWEEVREQRRIEIENLLEHVREVQAINPELSFADVLALFEQRSPNQAPAAASPAPDSTNQESLTQEQ